MQLTNQGILCNIEPMQQLLWTRETAGETVMVKATSRSLRFSDKEDAILEAFTRYYYLTADHITRLFYSAGSSTHVKAKLKTLADDGYLQRLYFIEKKPGKARH